MSINGFQVQSSIQIKLQPETSGGKRCKQQQKRKGKSKNTLKGAPDIGIIKHKQYFFKNLYVFAYHM